MAYLRSARWIVAAAATGAATVVGMVVVRERRAREAARAGGSGGGRPREEPGGRVRPPTSAGTDDLAARVRRAVREGDGDAEDVQVGGLATDMVELTGSVRRREDADRAVHAAQAVTGVRTVVNRLEVVEEVERARDARARREEGDPALTERGVYGLGVGMGRRRQGAETDPDRPDDRNPRKSRELEAARVAEEELPATGEAEGAGS